MYLPTSNRQSLIVNRLLIVSILCVFFSFTANAQTAGDSLAAIINVDSGIVNIDTTVAIHNSTLSIDGGSTTHTGELNIGVANSNGDITPDAHPGDVVIHAGESDGGDGQPPVSYTNIFDCEQPGIITEAGFHQWNLLPCNPDQCPGQTFDIFHLDKHGVTINTGFNDITCTWHAATTINGNLVVNGNTTFSGPLHFDNPATTPIKAFSATQSNGSQQIENFIVYTNGFVKARDVYVTAVVPFPDFVFNTDYKLMPLLELEKYITAHHHLPLMPTAAEVEEKGASLAELQRLTTQKVEELTLYLIEQNKQIEELKKQNQDLQKKVTAIAAQH